MQPGDISVSLILSYLADLFECLINGCNRRQFVLFLTAEGIGLHVIAGSLDLLPQLRDVGELAQPFAAVLLLTDRLQHFGFHLCHRFHRQLGLLIKLFTGFIACLQCLPKFGEGLFKRAHGLTLVR